jgi:hypothetical protein
MPLPLPCFKKQLWHIGLPIQSIDCRTLMPDIIASHLYTYIKSASMLEFEIAASNLDVSH